MTPRGVQQRPVVCGSASRHAAMLHWRHLARRFHSRSSFARQHSQNKHFQDDVCYKIWSATSSERTRPSLFASSPQPIFHSLSIREGAVQTHKTPRSPRRRHRCREWESTPMITSALLLRESAKPAQASRPHAQSPRQLAADPKPRVRRANRHVNPHTT